jgi:hypothetical protein
VKAAASRSAEPHHLSLAELALYKRLAGKETLLEQERIPLECAERRLRRVIVR